MEVREVSGFGGGFSGVVGFFWRLQKWHSSRVVDFDGGVGFCCGQRNVWQWIVGRWWEGKRKIGGSHGGKKREE